MILDANNKKFIINCFITYGEDLLVCMWHTEQTVQDKSNTYIISQPEHTKKKNHIFLPQIFGNGDFKFTLPRTG